MVQVPELDISRLVLVVLVVQMLSVLMVLLPVNTHPQEQEPVVEEEVVHQHRYQEDPAQFSLGITSPRVVVVVDVPTKLLNLELLVVIVPLHQAHSVHYDHSIHMMGVRVISNGGLILRMVLIMLVPVAVVLVVLAQHLALEQIQTIPIQVVLASLYNLDMLIVVMLLGVVAVDVMMYQATGLIVQPQVELVHPVPIVEVGLKHYAWGPLLVD